MLGDIDFGKHLIQLKSDDKVVVHKGHAINLGETVKILIGSFQGRYYESIKSNGLVISGRGLFKFIGYLSKDKTVKFIADHFDIRYIKSTNFIDSPVETDYSGISFYLINFPFFN
jgi:hypothetical protein